MRWFAALLVALLVLGSVTGVGVGQQADEPTLSHDVSPHSVQSHSVQPHSVEPYVAQQTETANETTNGTGTEQTIEDGTTIRVSLEQTGDARWDVTAQFPLRSENETAAFRQLASEYENGGTDIGFTPETFERVAAHTTTNREMAIQSVNRSGKLLENGTLGTLTLSFTWTNFSQVSGDRILLGDVFVTESGTWLPELADDQTLILEGPPGHYISQAPAGHSENRIRYEGPRTLDEGDFRVTYTLTNPDSTTTPGGTTTGPLPNISGLPGLVLLLLIAAGGAGAYAWTQRRDNSDVTEVADAAADAPPAQSTGDERDTGSAGDEISDGDVDDEADVALLSDEERVLRLLRKNDGRMKQADIVKETNWSNAKVSQLLSKMDDNDDVDKLRIGRENLITLPDEDVTDVD